MIAGDLGTVGELNIRAQSDRIASGQVTGEGTALAGGVTAGVGDQVVTRQNNQRLVTGRHWVRNGDQWTVTATHEDGAMTVQRLGGIGQLVLPADYVRQHVELAYASTAHRSQGRNVDTAHALVTPTTTREVLYVSATRGRESNRIYVDTRYDPDVQTSHDGATEAVTARDVLCGVLRNAGADLAAHEMIRRHQAEAEGMERLSAEYLTLATAERWDALLARSGLSETDLEAVRSSEAHGPLVAAFRDAEARGLDIEDTFPLTVAARSLDDALDVAAVLHGRVERWTQTAGGRRRATGNLVAGLIPRAQGVTDPDLARALGERADAMEQRARTLAEQAIETRPRWVQRLGTPPPAPARRERWMHEISTIAAYRDRWHITGQRPIGAESDVGSFEQQTERQRARTAMQRAVAISRAEIKQPARHVLEAQVQVERGVEL